MSSGGVGYTFSWGEWELRRFRSRHAILSAAPSVWKFLREPGLSRGGIGTRYVLNRKIIPYTLNPEISQERLSGYHCRLFFLEHSQTLNLGQFWKSELHFAARGCTKQQADYI